MSEDRPDYKMWGMTDKEYEDRKRLIFKLRNKGLTYTAIGEQVGVSRSRALAIHRGTHKQKKKRKEKTGAAFFQGGRQ